MHYEYEVVVNGGSPTRFNNIYKALDEFRFHDRQLGRRVRTLELKRVEVEDAE